MVKLTDWARWATAALAAAFAAHSSAQCEDQWLPGTAGATMFNNLYELANWDPDGSGPLAPQLILGGDFPSAGELPAANIARWDSAAWQPLGSGVDGPVKAITSWDGDGPGPAPPVLIAGGDFLQAGGLPASRIALWDGEAWHPLGPGLDNTVLALISWDPDADGPESPLLIAAGTFLNAGSTPVSRIAAWDGASWNALGPGLSGGTTPVVRALATVDNVLYAGGNFLFAGAATANHIAAWDGATWHPLGPGLIASSTSPGVTSMTAWDPDGTGPLGPDLIVVGGFNFMAAGSLASRAARWNGTSWAAFGSLLYNDPMDVTVADFDGPGPLAHRPVVVGRFPRGVSSWSDAVLSWNGSNWESMDAGDQVSLNVVYAASVLDPDGDGPRPPQLAVAGSFTSLGSSPIDNIARWDNGQWLGFGSSTADLGDVISTLRIADPDAGGPMSVQVIAGGRFNRAGGELCDGIARWDGLEWHAFTPPLSYRDASVACMTEWDPDGPGPERSLLVIGGDFPNAGSTTVNNIAAWDGSAWRALSTGITGTGAAVYALASWDPDGPGPQNPLLVAGGQFSTAGGVAARSIAAWNGTNWMPFGPGMHREVYTLFSWDRDAGGPETPTLLAGGWFTVIGTTINNMAYWDGQSWSQMGTPLSWVQDVKELDLDGPGPASPQLFAATGVGSPTGTIQRWDGLDWTQIASMAGPVLEMTVWDADGHGPGPGSLVAIGNFTSIDGVPISRIARWDGAAWFPFGAGLTGPSGTQGACLTTWDPDGPGPLAEQLLAGGNFQRAGDVLSQDLAKWGPAAPWLVHQPVSTSAQLGEMASFSVTLGGGHEVRGPASFRWRQSGVPIFDGPTPDGSLVSGAATPTLFIVNAQASDAGDYDCVITTDCGSALSNPASMTVSGCPVDFNGDGVIDFSDYLEFLNLFDALDPRADLNGDGVIDFADYLEFLNHYDAGC
ncbi:MAG: hypothetical protein IT436_15875 [Phycisphaerales bacterium]|nr:hypothetical protein [Phycisphaerales bacterium]